MAGARWISIRPRRALRRLRARAQATAYVERFFRRPVIRMVGGFSSEPPIFHMMYDEPDYEILFQALRGRPAYFLFKFQWSVEKPRQVARIARDVALHHRRHPAHRFIYLCNTERQTESFAGAGLRAIFCNSNALLDERIFRILPGTEKRFDAVYDAQTNRFKRHHLAARVESLALISYRPTARPLGETTAYGPQDAAQAAGRRSGLDHHEGDGQGPDATLRISFGVRGRYFASSARRPSPGRTTRRGLSREEAPEETQTNRLRGASSVSRPHAWNCCQHDLVPQSRRSLGCGSPATRRGPASELPREHCSRGR